MKNKKIISKIASLLLLTVLIPGIIGKNLTIRAQGFTLTNLFKNFTKKIGYHTKLGNLTKDMLKSEFQIHFIDVGAADCAVIKYTDKAWLVDAGFSLKSGITDVTKYLPEIEITTLYGALLTHAHNDHYWKFKYIFEQFNPQTFYQSYDRGVTKLIDRYEKIGYASRFKEPLEKFKSERGSGSCISVSAGDVLFKDENLSIQVISPTREYKEENNNSIVLFVQYKDKRILLMGDAGVEAESDIMQYCYKNNINIRNVDIVKIGHHGSDTSSSLKFVNLVNPSIIVNSTGGNDLTLGMFNLHEHSSIIERWKKSHFESTRKEQIVLTTEEQNNIVVYYQNGELKLARQAPVT